MTERAVVRTHLMRNTVHLVTAREGVRLLAYAAAGADALDVHLAPPVQEHARKVVPGRSYW